ncbi:hypothetical protein H6G94_33660 [Nostoc punctiforme FACHB-252]|uniref:Uncharacterized protein n=1 Tax=Nostoc punctiforme FACHB-252 TaxID=1357509 RepID=A0ABR8HM40_NOSPU|nr:hypothetical protein [Nostoc punctiforme]MBD2616135.1 hypothetical protein [Nostoc punctiforme FACHB-252]
MSDRPDYPQLKRTSAQKQEQEPDLTIEQLRLIQQQSTVNQQKNQLSEHKPDRETDPKADPPELNKHANSPKLGKEFGYLPASYYLEPASEQIPGLGEKGKNITPAGLAVFGRLGLDLTKSDPAPQHPTLDSRLAAIRAQRDSLSTPPTPEPEQIKQGSKEAENQEKNLDENLPDDSTLQQPSSPDAETHQERVDPSKMTLDERIAHNRATTATPEQSKQINQDLNR